MKQKNYLLGLALAAIFSWLAWLLVISHINPFSMPTLALVLFFITLFLAISTTFSITGYYLRLWFNKDEIYFYHLTVSMRQGILLATLICLALIFQILRVLTWWDGLLLVTAITLIEFYFLTKEKN